MDDFRLGRMARVLRQRLNVRQEDVAMRAGVGHDTVSRIERGEVDGMTLATIRRVFAVFDAEVVIYVRWRGGDVDRLLDRRHAAMGEALVARVNGLGWTVIPEVSFSEFGERGSIDLLGWHATTQTLLVIEIKTEITSIEETLRRHDVKSRLGARIARERFGWEAESVARLLVLPEERTARRQVERHEGLFLRSYRMRGWELRRWLAAPAVGRTAEPPAPVPAACRPRAAPPASSAPPAPSGLLFLPIADAKRGKRTFGPRKRIRVAPKALVRLESGLEGPQVSTSDRLIGA